MPEPIKIRAGDSVSWSASFSDYSAADGWGLSYVVIGKPGGIEGINGSANGSGFGVSIAAAETKKLPSGDYRLVAVVSKDLERITVYDKPIKVQENLFDLKSGSDIRSQAQRGLNNINAVLENRATKDQESYSINGRSLGRTPIADLITLQRFYQREVFKEKKAERIADGLGGGNTIKVRF